jgi:hypothetical protein
MPSVPMLPVIRISTKIKFLIDQATDEYTARGVSYPYSEVQKTKPKILKSPSMDW